MTDLNRWYDLVQVYKLRAQDYLTDEWKSIGDRPVFNEYITIPLNPYQIGNLLDLLSKNDGYGDWHSEIVMMLATAMEKAGLEEVHSNDGRVFAVQKVFANDIK